MKSWQRDWRGKGGGETETGMGGCMPGEVERVGGEGRIRTKDRGN